MIILMMMMMVVIWKVQAIMQYVWVGGYRWGAILNQEAGGGFGKWRIVEREKMQDELSNHIVGRHLSVGQILKRLFVRQY